MGCMENCVSIGLSLTSSGARRTNVLFVVDRDVLGSLRVALRGSPEGCQGLCRVLGKLHSSSTTAEAYETISGRNINQKPHMGFRTQTLTNVPGP